MILTDNESSESYIYNIIIKILFMNSRCILVKKIFFALDCTT